MTGTRQERLDRALETHRAGRVDLAEMVYRKLLLEDPTDAEALHMLGIVSIGRGEIEAAYDFVSRAVNINESAAKYHNTLGAIHLAAKRFAAAEVAFLAAVKRDNGMLDAAFNLGNTYQEWGRLEAAVKIYKTVLDATPDNLDALNNMGGALSDLDRRGDAAEAFEKAHAVAPTHPGVLQNLVNALERLNRIDEAHGKATELLKLAPGAAIANILMARIELRRGELDSARTRLVEITNSGADSATVVRANFGLGQVLDRMGETTAAFQAFQRANAGAIAELPSFDPENSKIMRRIRRCRDWYTPERLASLPQTPPPAAVPPPIFMVGFPRSGTTLLERMLDAHPDLVTTGERSPIEAMVAELDKDDAFPVAIADLGEPRLDALRRQYRESVESGARRIVDKLPLNTVNLGLILALFPDAPIIFSQRDPRDVCLSCYMQEFQLNDAMAHFADLATTARLYTEVLNLWRAFRKDAPAKILEYRYEDLVSDFETVVRDILEFADVPWHDGILDYETNSIGAEISTPSYRDVSETLHQRGVGRWRRYADELTPVLPTLASAVETLGYPPE